jgi:gluconokinase
MDVVIGIDSGTTATKGVSAGADGRVRDTVSVACPLQVPSPGRAELDAQALADAAVSALNDTVRAASERGDRVIGVALSAAMHGLVPLSADGAPRGPLITWADQRAAETAAALDADGRAGPLHDRTGTPVHAMSPMVKLAHLTATDPEAVRRTPRWGGVKELVAAALCGGPLVVDRSSASTSGLLDLRGGRWDDEALAVAGVRPGQLAEVLPTTAVLPGLRADVARAAGLPAGLPVVIGAADGVLANLGIGAVRPGVAAVSVGTSGALRVVVREPVVDPGRRLFCYALTDDRWVLGGAVSNGGSVVRWAAEAFASSPAGAEPSGEDADRLDADLLEQAAAVPAGSAGLLCLPYLLGERAPWWRSGLSGAYLGLRRDHRRPHLVRAAVEGVCQLLALVRDAVTDTGTPVDEVRATGGAMAAPLWSGTLAAALDLPVRLADSPEGTGLGACLLGLHALGALPDLDAAADLVAVGAAVPYDPAAVALYRRMRPLVERSTTALADVLRELDAVAAPAAAEDFR